MSRPPSDLAQLVNDRMAAWQSRGLADARAVIIEHPELRDEKSLFMNLALTEYALRKEAGDDISRQDFCDRFPEYRESLFHLLEVDDQFDRCPQWSRHDVEEFFPQAGDTFLGYEILEPLGRGGLARVFLARERQVGDRLVVLKVSTFSAHEAHMLGKLDHPSIVPIYSVQDDENSGLSAICMPFLGQATCIDLLDAAFGRGKILPKGGLVVRVAQAARPLTPIPTQFGKVTDQLTYPEAVCRLGLELAEALVAAHGCGIVHRDIKPSNILLAYSGRAMLLDFNLSTGGQDRALQIGGTLAYMAPECIRSLMSGGEDSVRHFDPRCDLYSLGAVLYQLLTGQLPHGAVKHPPRPDDHEGWLACKSQTPPRNLGYLTENRLAAMVLKCLEFDAQARYASAEALAADLRAYLGPPARLVRFSGRHRRELLAGAVAVAAGVVGLAALIGSRPSELDVLYQEGLKHYDGGEFGKAAERFSQCLQLKPGWHPALFGRGQSLRALKRFREARNDYLGLKDVEPAWAYAFAGYCNIRVNDFQAAWYDFTNADKNNLQDVASLLNFALVHRGRGRYAEAAAICTRVLAIEPSNKQALHERSMMLLALTKNIEARLPEPQAFIDAKEYCRLEPSFEGPYFCAYIHAQAALKDQSYEPDAIRYLIAAMKRGIPGPRLQRLPLCLKRLLPFIDASLVDAATINPHVQAEFTSIEPPMTADWQAFLRSLSPARDLLAAKR